MDMHSPAKIHLFIMLGAEGVMPQGKQGNQQGFWLRLDLGLGHTEKNPFSNCYLDNIITS